MKHLFLLLSLVISFAGPSLSKDLRPNILFIFTDDQRWDAMGCAGNGIIKTPNIDSLAKRGTRFANAFVTLSICSPSRAASLTGMYGSSTGVTTLDSPIKPGNPTFAQLLKKEGYQTGFAGKWHLRTTPQQCGFDFVSAFYSNGPYYNRMVKEDGKEKKIPGFIDDYVAGQAIKFMRSAVSGNGPFVLWMCTQIPHMNHKFDWNAREESKALYNREALEMPANWKDDLSGKPPYLKQGRNYRRAQDEYGYGHKEAVQGHIQRYYACITEMDAAVGRVLSELRELGIEDNTWIIFMGDNGWMMGEHGMTSKVLPYEESMRVPMIVTAPGRTGVVNRNLVLNIDLAATILDIAGVTFPDKMQGHSLIPLLGGDIDNWRSSVFYEAPTPVLGSKPLMAVRTDRWKYIRTYEDSECTKIDFEELYDLHNDSVELHNLAPGPEYRETLSKMKAELDKLRGEYEPVK